MSGVTKKITLMYLHSSSVLNYECNNFGAQCSFKDPRNFRDVLARNKEGHGAGKVCWYCHFSSKAKGPGEKGATGYCPKILLLKSAKVVLCSFHRSHREICTRNRPLSETNFWMISAPSSPPPLCFTAYTVTGKKKGTNPNFWVRISSCGVGVFPRERVGGPKP